jgi:RimJ/RimL family protein N-acetyltransferase
MTAPSSESVGWTVRSARPDDAAGVITLLTAIFAEPVNNLLTEPGEFTMTEEQERVFLAEQAIRPNWAAFVAVTDATPPHIIGLVTADGKQRRAIRHCANIGISVAQGWRGRGVGRALMQRVVDWARGSSLVTRLELEVLTRNEIATHLYERLGFEREGLRRHALLRNGEYLDEYVMALLL